MGGLPRIHPVESAERPTTVGSAIRIVDPVHRADVDDVLERSGGSVVTVSDAELLGAWQHLRFEEGVFSEPASAAGIAGLARGSASAGERVGCVITRPGLKDPAAIDR